MSDSVSTNKLYREKLPNGMEVVILENHRSPLVSLNVVVKVGSMYENERINGISHFCEHLFFRGTLHRTGQQFKHDIEALGGQSNADTTQDATHFFINLPSAYVKQGLDLLSDALINNRLAPSEVDEERKAVLMEYNMDKEQPGAVMEWDLFGLAFQKHPYHMSVIGTEKTIKGITMQDLADFKRRYYIPKRTCLIIVGDVTPSELMPTVRDYFAPFTGNNDLVDDIPIEPKHPEGMREKVERKEVSNAYVAIAFKAPSVRDRPDIYRVDTMCFMLGMGDGSILNQQLVEDKKLALEAEVEFQTMRDPGLIIFNALCPPGKVEKVKQTILDTIAQVRDGKFSQADFGRAKAMLVNTTVFGNESNDGMGNDLSLYAAIDDVDFALSYVDEVKKVTFQDVVDAARKYLDPKDFTVLVVRPPDRRASAHEVAERSGR